MSDILPFPKGKFDVILADPPWQFSNYSDEWHKQMEHSRWVGKKYGVMSTEDISNLPVSEIAAENCVLLMWATMPKLQEAFKVIKGWGFKYKTCAFVWVKQNKVSDDLFTGMGFWTRSNAELCLLSVKGHPKRISTTVRQVVVSHRREHSRKPDEVRERIVELLGDKPRIELFARERVPGWDAWGLEVPEMEQ